MAGGDIGLQVFLLDNIKFGSFTCLHGQTRKSFFLMLHIKKIYIGEPDLVAEFHYLAEIMLGPNLDVLNNLGIQMNSAYFKR